MDVSYFNFGDPIVKQLITNTKIYCFVGKKIVVIDIKTLRIIRFINDPIFYNFDGIALTDNEKNMIIYKEGKIYKFNIKTHEITKLISVNITLLHDSENLKIKVSNDCSVIILEFANDNSMIIHVANNGSIKCSSIFNVGSFSIDHSNNVYYFEKINYINTGTCYLIKLNMNTGEKTMSKELGDSFYAAIREYSAFETKINNATFQLYVKVNSNLFVFNIGTFELVYARSCVCVISKKYVVCRNDVEYKYHSIVDIYNITNNTFINSFEFLIKRPNDTYHIHNNVLTLQGGYRGEYFINMTKKNDTFCERIKQEGKLKFATDDEKYVIRETDCRINIYNITAEKLHDQKMSFILGGYSKTHPVYNFMNNVLFDRNLIGEIFKFMPGPSPKYCFATSDDSIRH